MNPLRSTSRARLLAGGLGAVAVVAASGAVVSGAFAGDGSAPPAKPLAQAIADGLGATAPVGITARIRFGNRLLTSSSLTGSASPLLTGASGRLWAASDGRLRLELQSTSGDVQIVSDGSTLSVYDASSKTAYLIALPKRSSTDATADRSPAVTQIQQALDRAGAHATISGATPTAIAGQGAYSVRVSPKQNGGLVGAAELAFDAVSGVPLKAAIYATGSDQPVLELVATDISYGPIAASTLDVKPPADATVQRIEIPGASSGSQHRSDSSPSSTLTPAGAQKGLSFTLAAPDTAAGLARATLYRTGTDGVVARYGKGLGSIVVYERAAGSAKTQRSGAGGLGLPKVSIAGASGNELSTPLGTLLLLTRGDVSYTIVGSAPAASLEAAARDILR